MPDPGWASPTGSPWSWTWGPGSATTPSAWPAWGCGRWPATNQPNSLPPCAGGWGEQPDTLRNIHLNDGDIFDKAFPGGTFDGILASHLFHYLSPQALETLVARFHQWLRPGGRLYIQCWNIEGAIFSWFRPIWAKNKAAGIPWPGCIAHARELVVDQEDQDPCGLSDFLESFGDYLHAIEMDDLLKLLETSGFTLVKHDVGDTQVRDPSNRWVTIPACQVMVVAQKPAPGAGAGGGAGQR